MKEDYLFLDESKPNTNFRNFTLGGVVIEENIYENNIRPEIVKLKKECFGNESVILHEIEIRNKRGSYQEITKEQQETFFTNLNILFENNDINVLAVSINLDDLNKLYSENERNDIYYIALQLLMENYVHFLISNEGIGQLYLESTDAVNNSKLQNLFHMLKATGTLFMKKEVLQDRLGAISFPLKSDNIIGLQLADFIPNVLARKALGKEQKNFSIYKGIENKLYDGKIDRKDRFGFKIIG